MFRKLLIAVLCALFLLPAAGHAKDKDYEGVDAGYLVYAVGIVRLPASFEFPYRRLATPEGQPANDWKCMIAPKLGGAIYLKVKNPDFEGVETGQLVVRRLPPGSYEVQEFRFFGQIPGLASYKWSPDKPFALPFEIRAGEATYIGSFMRAMATATVRPDIGGGTYFIVADRSARDLPIAGSRLPAGLKVTSEVTDVGQFGLHSLVTDVLPEIPGAGPAGQR